MALPSKREFLSLNTNPATNKPFATFPGRGRFSAEAEAFAAANSTLWAEAAPAVKAARTVRPAAAASSPTAAESQDNGADRAAAALARREAKEAQIKDERSRGLRAPTPNDMPKRRPENTGFSVVNGILTRQDRCGNPGSDGLFHSVAQCPCEGGPRAFRSIEKEAGGPVLLDLDKPASLASA